ncbi:hypothetical protein H6G20_00885 [Desertifilum sp. FACHB-1129]|uniref:Alpha-amylase/branching enzyme C-terminal all beta domain-containing protein n=2 Tax=Desertifilum tharense IPPAS B-1220 TaxID=1781255 RepID=A0A1E5QNE1_9CYAN|nr:MULTISPECIES: alpha amylase C-terminal domain-containing protein [Desertifilum]MDA0210290.1 hypothetical protein [Cyanobacteria bacterium FC1]MBD2310236.1 hypothetical protein [Desertifilum sp. FACHB-1129]MBD2322612.1 hypothetical protein [Desertifilum sp. FACHB-866]MBD2333490.1 hypothetical protein [Desertifilum sp. FACHB-868]OEJ76160.1 hypothetical protein BH720_06300 [Desertifilum tharense IPPAS B-1220]
MFRRWCVRRETDAGDRVFANYANRPNEPQNLKWSLLENDRNRQLFAHYQQLIALRTQNPALQTGKIEFFHENPESRVFAYTCWNEEGSRVVVVANFFDRFLAGYAVDDFPADGTWREWTRGDRSPECDRQLLLDLGEYEAQVFSFQET